MKFLITLLMAVGVAHAQRSASGGYSAPGGDGGIFQAGYISENAEFGNTFSAQNFQPAYAGGRGGGAGGAGGAGGDNIAMLEKAVPGIPGQDYPILAEVPETSFSCDGQVDGGYYADTDAQCQVFHICTTDGQGGLTKYSFLCPNGTIFNQQYFICDWWFNFDCSEAQGLYSLNEKIAAEREASTQALLASASNSQATYVNRNGTAPAQSSYNAGPAAPPPPQPQQSRPQSSAAGGSYAAPAGNRGGAGQSLSTGNRGGAGQSQAAGSYSAPAGGQASPAAGKGGRKNSNKAPARKTGGGGGARGGSAPANANYGAPRPSGGSSSGGFGPSSGFGQGGASGPAAAAYGAPTSGSFGGPTGGTQSAGAGYGAPSGGAGSSFGALADSSAGSSYGAPESSDELPSYGK